MRRATVSLPVSVVSVVPVVALLAALALVLGLGSAGLGAGVAIAKPGLDKRGVKKIAAKVVKKKAKKLTVAEAVDAQNLGGLPPSAYATTVYTVDVPTATNVPSFDKTLPVVPAGTYQASVYLTAALGSTNAELFCTLYQEGQETDLLDVYGSRYQSFRTVAATRVVTVSGRLHLYCRTTTGPISAIPANPAYAAGQVSLLRVGSAAPLGAAMRRGPGASAPRGAPTR